MSALNDLVETFINGNLTDAKTKAKRHNHRALRQAYQDATGCSLDTAIAAADYLKGMGSFEEYCEAKRHSGDRH
jgi:hypothetical protein